MQIVFNSNLFGGVQPGLLNDLYVGVKGMNFISVILGEQGTNIAKIKGDIGFMISMMSSVSLAGSGIGGLSLNRANWGMMWIRV
eukprot:5266246-Karenia_brevis.AAC.1